MDRSIFGSLFDLNHDGKLDTCEQVKELMFLHDIIMGESKDVTVEMDPDLDEFDDYGLEDELDDDDY